jgi:5-formyltetrahydrofolate cyclo-ligase
MGPLQRAGDGQRRKRKAKNRLKVKMEADISSHKHFLRQLMKHGVLALSAAQKQKEIRRIMRRLAALPVFRQARTVALTLSLPHEMETRSLIRLCRQQKKRVVVPIVKPTKSDMDFVLLPGKKSTLRKNVYGILEPGPSARAWVSPKDIDLVVVPGRAFTPKGDRLGSGGGYYDRFLRRHPSIPTIALAFSVQVVHKLPSGLADKHIQIIISPNATYAS